MSQGAHLLAALRSPQRSKGEQPGAHADKVADGCADVEEEDDRIDAHKLLTFSAVCTAGFLPCSHPSPIVMVLLAVRESDLLIEPEAFSLHQVQPVIDGVPDPGALRLSHL